MDTPFSRPATPVWIPGPLTPRAETPPPPPLYSDSLVTRVVQEVLGQDFGANRGNGD